MGNALCVCCGPSNCLRVLLFVPKGSSMSRLLVTSSRIDQLGASGISVFVQGKGKKQQQKEAAAGGEEESTATDGKADPAAAANGGDGAAAKKKGGRGARSFYRVVCQDNGCGMQHDKIPDMLGRVLSGSKYGVRQTRSGPSAPLHFETPTLRLRFVQYCRCARRIMVMPDGCVWRSSCALAEASSAWGRRWR